MRLDGGRPTLGDDPGYRVCAELTFSNHSTQGICAHDLELLAAQLFAKLLISIDKLPNTAETLWKRPDLGSAERT